MVEQRLRVSLVHVVEALEDCDYGQAHELALAALEGGPVVDRDARRRSCPHCGWGPTWPGLVEDHVRRVHTTVPRAGSRRTVRTSAGRR